MSLTAAAGGFVVFLLTLPVVQGQTWGVTYTSKHICASKGSTVDMHCTYTYPSWVNGKRTEVKETFWHEPGLLDLKKYPNYADRVQYDCDSNECTLTVTDLRLSDSSDYVFRFITNQSGGKYSGTPGVTLTVTALQVQVNRITVNQSHSEAELKCFSSCSSNDDISYAWFKNGEKIMAEETSVYSGQFNPGDNVSCALKGYEDSPSPTLYAPIVPSVLVTPSGDIMEGSSVNLTCSGDANISVNYTWYKKNVNQDLQPLSKEPQLVVNSIQSSDSGEYYCTTENQLGKSTSEYIFIDVKYAPKIPSVSVSPSGEIVEGTSVTLTCSSDANPAANYTWYKENQTLFHGSEGIYNFTSISSEDRAMYFCKSENQYGQINSSSFLIDVLYAPKILSVSVSPSGEIVEGSSVNLTCSSDANPAANYTWYKENQTLFHGSEGIYNFMSISSEDRAMYYCKSENQYGQINSSSFFINVLYAPKLPSVSVSPSGEIVEGSSVNLTCSSDANPAANYTWYKENEDSPKASGQILTITDVRPEHSGNYYCDVQNRIGRNRITIHLTVEGAWKLITAGVITAIVLVVILISVALWIRASKKPKTVETMDNSAPTQPAEQQDDLNYATVHFTKKEADPLYSNIRPAQPQRHKEEEEMNGVVYATVKINSGSEAPRNGSQETEEDPAALYSTVNKTPK